MAPSTALSLWLPVHQTFDSQVTSIDTEKQATDGLTDNNVGVEVNISQKSTSSKIFHSAWAVQRHH